MLDAYFKRFFGLVAFVFFSAVSCTTSKLTHQTSSDLDRQGVRPAQGIGLNEFCDPIETKYTSGSPLLNLKLGASRGRAEYLAKKGLNGFCDPLGTVYSGGTPLFDESTGQVQTIESYLKNKKWVRN